MKKRRFALIGSIVLAGLATGHPVAAQTAFSPPSSPSINVPPPPAIPPPKIEVPAIPQLDAPPAPPRVDAVPRKSFGKRIDDCLSDSTAARLGPNERAEYSRGCANR